MRSTHGARHVLAGLLANALVLALGTSGAAAPRAMGVVTYSKYSYLLTGDWQSDCRPNFNYPPGVLVGGYEQMDTYRSGYITCYFQQ